jgi:hypothetical protein
MEDFPECGRNCGSHSEPTHPGAARHPSREGTFEKRFDKIPSGEMTFQKRLDRIPSGEVPFEKRFDRIPSRETFRQDPLSRGVPAGRGVSLDGLPDGTAVVSDRRDPFRLPLRRSETGATRFPPIRGCERG